MKGVSAPDYKREFVPVDGGHGWSVKFYSQLMGLGPVGSRLAKGSLPDIGLNADSQAECMVLCKQWNTWYDKEWNPLRKKASIRTSSRRRRVV